MSFLSKLPTYFLLIFPFLIYGVVYNRVNVGILIIISLLYFILCLNRHEKAVVCGFILTTILGFFGQMYHFPIPGSMIAFLLMLIFLGKDMSAFYSSRYIVPSVYILLFFTICLFAYFLTGDTQNSTRKIMNMSIHMVSAIVSFSVLKEFEDIRMERIAPMFLLESLILISLVMGTFFFFPFQGLFDFDAVRNTWIELKRLDIAYLNYHFMGIAAFIAAVFYLCERPRLITVFDYVFILACVWTQLLSGARQAVFGFILFFAFWLVYRQQRISIPMLFVSVLFVVGAYYGLQSIQSETFGIIYEQSSNINENINRNFDYPIALIKEHFWQGIGFGNFYNPSTDEVYPHNMILELLCEWGLIGTAILSIPLILFVALGNFSWQGVLSNASLCLFVVFPYLTRSMISGDLSDNIELFCGFFILFYSKNQIEESEKLEEAEMTEEIMEIEI